MPTPCLSLILAGVVCLPVMSAPGSPSPQAPVLGPVVEETLAAGTFLHLDAEATLATLQARITELVPRLKRALTAAQALPSGPLVLIYHGLGEDPQAPFRLEAGFQVPEGTAPAGGARVRTLAPFHAMALTTQGPLSALDRAYRKLYPELLAQGKVPTGESRQMLLYWEHPESANNLVQILAGIQ